MSTATTKPKQFCGMVFTHANGSTLSVRDYGTHMQVNLHWHGPLDEQNNDAALDWVREKCQQSLTKPTVLTTPTQQLLLLPQNGAMSCHGVLVRKRVSEPQTATKRTNNRP